MHISECVDLESVPTSSNSSAMMLDGFHLCKLQFTDTGVAHKILILCAFRISVILVSIYFLTIKILFSKLIQVICLTVDVLMGWELWDIRLVT